MLHKRRKWLKSIAVLFAAFICCALLLTLSGTSKTCAETQYRYVRSGDKNFTVGDVVLLVHDDNKAMGYDVSECKAQTLTVVNDEITSTVSDNMLWRVEEGEPKGKIKFRLLSNNLYLSVANDGVFLSSTGTSFYNELKLHDDNNYIRAKNKYTTKTDATLADDFTIYKREEKASANPKASFYDGENLLAEKEITAQDGKTTIEALSVSNPQKDGYTFVGWKSGNSVYSSSQEITVTENVAFYAQYTVGKAYRASASPQGDVALHVYMRFSESTAQESLGALRISVAQRTTEIPFSDADKISVNGLLCHRFTCRVSAREYDETITFKVVESTGNGTEFRYSVKEYIEKAQSATGEAFDGAKPLLSAMLDYCQAAKGYFTKTDVKNISTVFVADVSKYKTTTEGEDETITISGATLVLQSQTALRVYFTATNKPICSIDGIPVEAVETGRANEYYLEIKDVSAKDLDETHIFVIGGYTIRCSALSYVYSVLNGEYDENLQNLVKALYLYNEQANAYFQGGKVA